MESETPSPPTAGAHQVLDALDSDRETLARLVRAPRWLAPGIGLVAAAVVAVPALPPGVSHTPVLVGALLAALALLSGYRRSIGIKLARAGAWAWMTYALAVGISLLLLSVSYGLAAADLHGWIAACAAAGFVLVAWLVRLFVAAARDRLRHDL